MSQLFPQPFLSLEAVADLPVRTAALLGSLGSIASAIWSGMDWEFSTWHMEIYKWDILL